MSGCCGSDMRGRWGEIQRPRTFQALRLKHYFQALVFPEVEDVIPANCVFGLDPMGDDEARVDVPILNVLEKRLHVFVHVALARAYRQRAIHQRAEREFVIESAVDSNDRSRASISARHCRLPKHRYAIAFQPHRLFGAIVVALKTWRMRLQSDGIDACVGAASACELFQRLEDIGLLVVDGDVSGRALARNAEAIWNSVDRDHRFRTK